jgi:hypothetical protein
MPSTYSSTASVAASDTRKSRTSPKSTSAAPPSDTTLVKPTPAACAQSSSAPQMAPDCDTSAKLPGRAAVRANVASRPTSVRIAPRQLGPRMRTPWRRAAASISPCSARPASPASPNPLESTIAALTPAAPASAMMPGTVRAGVASTARSGAAGSLARRA